MPDAFISSHDINFCPRVCVCVCVCVSFTSHTSVGIIELTTTSTSSTCGRCCLVSGFTVSPLLDVQAQRCRCHGRRRWTWPCSRMTVEWSRLCSMPRPRPSTSKISWPGWRNGWLWVRLWRGKHCAGRLWMWQDLWWTCHMNFHIFGWKAVRKLSLTIPGFWTV